MSLLKLPAELLVQILSYLGHEFFSQNLSHLAISKLWFELAWPIFSQKMSLNTTTLIKLAKSKSIMARSRPLLNSVEIHLKGFGSCDTDHRNVAAKRARLEGCLEYLGGTLQLCPRLRQLKLTAFFDSLLELDSGQRKALMPRSVAGVLRVEGLTSLELDLTGRYFSEQRVDSPVHFCYILGPSLRSLQRFYCRMERICESLLAFAIRDTPPNLEEVIINLSLSDLSHSYTSYRFPRTCNPRDSKTSLECKEAIEEQAKTLARKLRNPRMIRVISHELPSLAILALDAITERRILLEDNKKWDADGEELQEVDDTNESEREEEEGSLFANDSLPTPWIVL